MSTQEEREAAVRGYVNGSVKKTDLLIALQAFDGWLLLPSGRSSMATRETTEQILTAWCDHLRALDAAALAECKANTDSAVDPIAAARATLEAAGWEVKAPRVGGYEDAPAMLAWLEARWSAVRAQQAVAHDDFAVYDSLPGEITLEIARLRALGVTPAVLK